MRGRFLRWPHARWWELELYEALAPLSQDPSGAALVRGVFAYARRSAAHREAVWAVLRLEGLTPEGQTALGQVVVSAEG